MIKIATSGKAFEKLKFEEMVKILSEVGYRGLEIRTCDTQLPITATKKRAKELYNILAEHNIAVTCISSFTGNYSEKNEADCAKQLDEFKAFVDLAGEIECDMVRHWAGWCSSESATAEKWERSVRWMQKAAEIADKANVKVGLEIHHRSLLDNVESILKYLGDVDRKNVVLIHDAENMYHDGVEYGASAVRKLGNHIYGVHIKDVVTLEDKSNPHAHEYKGKLFCSRLINEGGVDHYSVFQGLKDIGYEGYLTVETSDLIPDVTKLARHEYLQVRQIAEEIFGKDAIA